MKICLFILQFCFASLIYGNQVSFPAKLPIPFEEIEAEACDTDGLVSLFTTTYYQIGSEASGRRYVELGKSGQSVQWKPKGSYNSLVLRFCLPDSEDGKGTTAQVKISSPGFTDTVLDLSSRLSWIYGTFPWTNEPSDDYAHQFFDEAQVKLDLRKAGTPLTITVLNAEAFPVILDLADFELVSEPLSQPKGFLNIRDFGAKGDGKTNDSDALRKAIDESKKSKTGVFIPPGEYYIGVITINGCAIQGAGMWHSRFVGPASRFNIQGGECRFSDFSIFGQTTTRDDKSSRDLAFGGTPGPGSRLERIWVEHKKCAFWVGNGGNKPGVSGLVITQCRFRNLMADAVNFCNGTSDSIVDNTHIRYSGDDALATWSVSSDPPCQRNSFINNTISLPWLANGIALYGGESHTVMGNIISDTVHTGSGIYLSANFKAAPFTGTHLVKNNTLTRCGTALSDQGGSAGALRLLAWDSPMTGAVFRFENNKIMDAVKSGVSIGGPFPIQKAVFIGTTITNSGAMALELKAKSQGLIRFEDSRGFDYKNVEDNSAGSMKVEWAK